MLTLGAETGEVIKIETLEKSGERKEASDDELALLSGDDEVEEIGAALEEAYTAGVADAINQEEKDEEEIFQRLQRAAGRQLLRRGMRQFILRRVIRRDLMERRVRTRNGGQSELKA